MSHADNGSHVARFAGRMSRGEWFFILSPTRRGRRMGSGYAASVSRMIAAFELMLNKTKAANTDPQNEKQ